MQDPKGWRAQPEQARYWALSAVGTHLIDVWRWYFGDPAGVGGALAAPVHHGPHEEVATLILDYPDPCSRRCVCLWCFVAPIGWNSMGMTAPLSAKGFSVLALEALSLAMAAPSHARQ
jgi:predicted dehydrogenase